MAVTGNHSPLLAGRQLLRLRAVRRGHRLFSSDSLHRLWGLFAAIGYVLAAAVVLAWKSSRAVDVALVLGVGGALLAPLSLLAATASGSQRSASSRGAPGCWSSTGPLTRARG